MTIVETGIAIVVTAVVGLVVVASIHNQGNLQFGANGVTEIRCINGVQFVIGADGRATQMFGPDAKPVVCR